MRKIISTQLNYKTSIDKNGKLGPWKEKNIDNVLISMPELNGDIGFIIYCNTLDRDLNKYPLHDIQSSIIGLIKKNDKIEFIINNNVESIVPDGRRDGCYIYKTMPNLNDLVKSGKLIRIRESDYITIIEYVKTFIPLRKSIQSIIKVSMPEPVMSCI